MLYPISIPREDLKNIEIMTEISKNSETSGCNSLLTWSEELLHLSDLSAESGPLKVGFERVPQSGSSASSEDPSKTCHAACPDYFYGPTTLPNFSTSDHAAYIEEQITPSAHEGQLSPVSMVENRTHSSIRLTIATGGLDRLDSKTFASLATPRTPIDNTPGTTEATEKSDVTPRSRLGAACHGQFNGLQFPRYLASPRSSNPESSREMDGIPEPPDMEVRLKPSGRVLQNESKIYPISRSVESQEKESFRARGESIVVARDHANIIGTSRVVCGRKYREYPCPNCQKLFAPINIDATYTCEVPGCDQTFNILSNARRHSKRHKMSTESSTDLYKERTISL
ncbi:hypothetical protein H4Q26_011778 [Puccinia striiformis f. sp. tritici PST-130]|nr:hypothetical protein H4Q26_011778 [Puccinia striiformis f. sp. tritici PST-130]